MAKINKSKRALWIGRFQPFHLGHLHVLKDILADFSNITIVIGSAQEDYTIKNPMTSKERYDMVEGVFRSLGVKKSSYKIVLAEDIPTNSLWAKYIAKKAGSFSEVVTASPLTKLLFDDSGYEVLEHHLYNRRNYSGTEIRRRMLAGKRWENFVPVSVFIDLQKNSIATRIEEISSSDNPYS